MQSSRRSLAALLALVLLVSCPFTAHAQFGALKDKLKKKATQMVTGKPADAAANADAPESPAFVDTNVVEITAESLGRFESGLRAEAVRRKEVDAEIAKMKSPQDYEKCKMEFYMSAEGQKATQAMTSAAGDGATQMAEMKKLEAATVAHCGPNPDDYETKRALNTSISKAGAAASKFSPRQHAILRERLLVFFGKDTQAQWHVRGDRKGTGMYVFSQEEVDALRAQETVLRGLLKDQL